MEKRKRAEIYTNTPLSKAVVVPELETVPMNGFAWSADLGLIIAAGASDDEIEKTRMQPERYGWWKRPGDK